MSQIASVLCWVGIAGVLWTTAGYPLLLMLRSWLRPRPPLRAEIAPSVCVVITAFNEESHIARKLVNTLALEWPRELLDVIVVSDGSKDATVAIARQYEAKGLRVIALPVRSGKHVCQGLAVKKSSSEIVVFTDVTTMLEPSSLRLLVRAFSDPQVGCVSGVDRALSPTGAVQGESLYVRYEMAIRDLEGREGSMVSASGCFFAVRRDLCGDWPDDLTSDFALPLSVRLRGLRTLCDQEARCTYRVLEQPRAEFDRKVRTVVHGIQVVRRFSACLNPFRTGFFALQLLSHKVFRWALPFMLITVFAATLALLNTSRIYQVLLAVQLAPLASAIAGLLAPALTRYSLVRLCLFVVMINVSMLVAWKRAFAPTDSGVWEPTRR